MACVARNGPASVDVLRCSAIDVVILDLNMPENAGLEVLSLIRPEFPAMKVVLVASGYIPLPAGFARYRRSVAETYRGQPVARDSASHVQLSGQVPFSQKSGVRGDLSLGNWGQALRALHVKNNVVYIAMVLVAQDARRMQDEWLDQP